ncbi:MAG: hypothetical protein ACLFR2_08100 [Candidatus Kapaibacterium sp.]
MRFFLAIIIIIINSAAVIGQEPDIKLNADTNNVRIGEWIGLDLRVKADTSINLKWPDINETVGSLELIEDSGIDTAEAAGYYEMSRKLTVTSFDSGSYSVPPFSFVYERQGFDRPFAVSTDSLMLNFRTVTVDTSKPIRDIKPVMDVQMSIWRYWPYMLGGLLLIAAAAAVYLILKNRKRNKAEIKQESYDPQIPPHIFALRELKNLENEKLWQKDRIKQYHIRLTEIIRIYIERRFNIPAPELTSEELLDFAQRMDMSDEAKSNLRQILHTADLAKFAKFKPMPDENTLSMSNAVNFVEITKSADSSAQEGSDVQ